MRCQHGEKDIKPKTVEKGTDQRSVPFQIAQMLCSIYRWGRDWAFSVDSFGGNISRICCEAYCNQAANGKHPKLCWNHIFAKCSKTKKQAISKEIACSHKKSGTPEGIRTPDLLVRSQTLYPAELLAHLFTCGIPVRGILQPALTLCPFNQHRSFDCLIRIP